MPQKIKGNIGEAGRILILDESDLSTIEINEVIGASGDFDIEVPVSGTKMVIARNNNGETIGYGAVSSVFEPVLEVPMDVTSYVTANADDGFWRSSAFYAASTNLYYGNYPTNLFCHGFWNFSNVAIPQGATINSAYVRLRAQSPSGASVPTVIIYSLASDNAVSPTNLAEALAMNLQNGVLWNTVPTPSSGTWYNTMDISTQVQAVINRPGWVSGNKLLIALKHNSGVSGAYRNVYTRDGGVSTELHVNYMGIPE